MNPGKQWIPARKMYPFMNTLWGTGGPGGPGVWLATRAGSLLTATRFGPYYDLIGFDPRGMSDIFLYLIECTNVASYKVLAKRRTFNDFEPGRLNKLTARYFRPKANCFESISAMDQFYRNTGEKLYVVGAAFTYASQFSS